MVDATDEGDGAVCPVCLEHPHNAVILICCSHANGCRPYICDTSYPLSNCLEQLRKLKKPINSQSVEENSMLRCPLCRGDVLEERVVEEDIRNYMNSKSRNCSRESCSFVGNYAELCEHATHDHPNNDNDDVSAVDSIESMIFELSSLFPEGTEQPSSHLERLLQRLMEDDEIQRMQSELQMLKSEVQRLLLKLENMKSRLEIMIWEPNPDLVAVREELLQWIHTERDKLEVVLHWLHRRLSGET